MTLMELKKCIETQVVPEDFIIFLCSENSFIADQYIDAICEINNLTRTNIHSLQAQTSALSLVLDQNDELNVLKVDNFDELLIDYSSLTNTVVICNKIDKKIKQFVTDYIIEVPKLVDWQVKSYINLICPILEPSEVDWLYDATGGDVYKIINEVDKVKLFPKAEQKQVLNELRFSQDSDLYAISLFDLADAIIRNNKPFIYDFLKHENLNFDLMSIVGVMLQKVKNLILTRTEANRTATELGISDKYYRRLSNETKNLPLDRLSYLLSFLTTIDLKLKSGLLDMSKTAQIDYLIANTII
ncbi:MAG: hypothetical protein J6X03_02770 [Bacilli bacterium]|nr:hypothetical protein [Bacilli bacterium]